MAAVRHNTVVTIIVIAEQDKSQLSSAYTRYRTDRMIRLFFITIIIIIVIVVTVSVDVSWAVGEAERRPYRVDDKNREILCGEGRGMDGVT